MAKLNRFGGVVAAYLAGLSFAEALGEAVGGHAPTNATSQVVGKTPEGGKIHKLINSSLLKFGTKSKSGAVRNADEGERIQLPAPKFRITPIEIDGVEMLEITSTIYGVARVVEQEAKDNRGNLLGRMTKQLKIATTRSAVPVMAETEDGERSRLYVQAPWVDPETGAEETLNFAVTAIEHVYGKLEDDVTRRGDKNDVQGKEQGNAQPRQRAAAQR